MRLWPLELGLACLVVHFGGEGVASEGVDQKLAHAIKSFNIAFNRRDSNPPPPFPTSRPPPPPSNDDDHGTDIRPPFPPPSDGVSPPFPPENGNEGGGITPPFPALLERRNLADYCRGGVSSGARLQLGECSPAFVVCERGAIRFENCATGEVFVDEECRAAATQTACFDASSNQLNHATEKLVQATGFCRNRSPPGFIHVATKENECSRQALICDNQGRALTIACSRGATLDPNDLECSAAPNFCHFVDKAQVQPVKTALERFYCLQNPGDSGNEMTPAFSSRSSPQTPSKDLSIASSAVRCKDWFVTCKHPNKEIVFCGQDSLFDKKLGSCRPTRPNDNCPTIFNCRGFEWRLIPFGKCRPEFIYCRGLIPVQFQCRSDHVLVKDKCVPKKSVAEEECQPSGPSQCERDERKPDNANCTRFFQCEPDKLSMLRWRHYECPEGEGFDPHQLECSDGYQCGSECKEGESFLITCYEYFQCRDQRYQTGVCPSKSRYSVEDRRCVFDPTCRHHDDEEVDDKSEQECEEDGFIPSKDCISYGVCKESIIHWKPCQLLNGRYHDQCPGCQQQQKPQQNQEESHSHESENQPAPPLYNLSNPDAGSNFSPTECTDGAVVLSKNDCNRFMKCYAGHWFMVECPNDKFYSIETQACTAEKCEPAGIYLSPTIAPDNVPDYKPPSDELQCTDSSCCSAESPALLAVSTDCQRYRECDLGTKRYVDRQCAYNEHFSGRELRCVSGSACESGEEEEKDYGGDKSSQQEKTCRSGEMKPLKKCGHVRLCLKEEWRAARCKNGMAFSKGRCSKTVRCDPNGVDDAKSSESLETHSHHHQHHNDSEVCHDGESKRHPYSCNKYLVCDHGIFVERICSYGALFNPKTQRCDLNYECDYANQPKCYEGQRKAVKQNCHAYLRCYEGAYVEETCPNKQVFDDDAKTCKLGKCHHKEEKEEEESDSKEEYEDDDSVASHGRDEKKKKHHKEEKSTEKKKKRNDHKKRKPASRSDEESSEESGEEDGSPGTGVCKESSGANGYRRDRHRCERFYQCSNGDWVPKTCPSGTVFNTHIGVCDWPRNVPGCEQD